MGSLIRGRQRRIWRHFALFNKVYFAITLLASIIMVGAIGYVMLADMSFLDALYMTVITISTVGFSELYAPSESIRLFTLLLIISGSGTYIFSVTLLSRYVIEGEFRPYIRNYKMNTKIKQLKGHVVVCGYGRNGRQAIKTLQSHRKSYVVVENNEELLNKLREEQDMLFIAGDATQEEHLIEAGIMNASAMITTLPKDSDNLFIVLSARELNSKLTIVSRASDDGSDKKLRIAGANNVIMPDRVGGAHMASLIVNDVNEFLDHISVQGPGEINLEEIRFTHLPEDFKYKTIKELEEHGDTGVSIIGFKTPQGEYIVNPSEALELLPGSKLFVLGSVDQIAQLNNMLGVDIS